MYRVLAMGCLAVLIMAGRPAWADDPPIPLPPPGMKPVPEVVTSAAEAQSRFATSEAGVREVVEAAASGALLEALPAGGTQQVRSPWTGSARLRYRLRVADEDISVNDVDNDMWVGLKLKYRDESLPGLSGSFHGRVFADLDDFGNVDGYNVWDSVWDTWSDRWNGQLFHAYVNYRFCNAAIDSVRLGRQWQDIGEYVTFDGLRVESGRIGRARLGAAAFIGMPVYYYDTSSRDGDYLGGVQLLAEPWRGSEWELDWTYLHNDNLYGDVENNLFNLRANQRIGQFSLAQLQYQHLDGEARLFRGIVDAVWPNVDVTGRAYLYTLINPQAELVYDMDAYYWVQLDLEPYWEANLSASKGIGNCFDVEAGLALRRLYEDGDMGRYNREWERYYVAASSYDWLVEGLSLTVSGELWSGADDMGTATFDIEYRPSRIWRFVLGTDYAAYSFDMYAYDERQNVYSVFGRVTWRPCPQWDLDARARVSDDDFGTYLTVDASIRYNF